MAASTYDRIFGGPLTAPPAAHPAPFKAPSDHPAMTKPSGLSSGWIKRAEGRGGPVSDLRTHELHVRDQWQTPLDVSKSADSNLTTRDITGAHPCQRPIFASSETALTSFTKTQRCTNPLKPLYQWGNGRSSTSPPGSGAHMLSRSLDTSDIAGAQLRRAFIPRPHTNYMTNKSDVNDLTARKKPGLNRPPGSSLHVADIRGGSSPSRARPLMLGPGQGTLRNDDIQGSTYAGRGSSLGAAPRKGTDFTSKKCRFGQQARVTAIHNGKVSQFGGGNCAHLASF